MSCCKGELEQIQDVANDRSLLRAAMSHKLILFVLSANEKLETGFRVGYSVKDLSFYDFW